MILINCLMICISQKRKLPEEVKVLKLCEIGRRQSLVDILKEPKWIEI